MLNTPKN